MTVVEFATWPVAANWSEPLAPGLQAVRGTAGCSNLFVGAAEEDPDTAQLVVVWDSLEHHQALMKAPNYPEIVGCIKSSLATGVDLGSLSMHHVDFGVHARTDEEANVIPALTAKVTEKVVITLNEGTTKEELVNVLNGIRDKVVEDSKLIGGISTPAVWGQTVEDPKVFVLLIGWDSTKLHYDTVSQKKYEPILGPLKASTKLNMKHIPFSKR